MENVNHDVLVVETGEFDDQFLDSFGATLLEEFVETDSSLIEMSPDSEDEIEEVKLRHFFSVMQQRTKQQRKSSLTWKMKY